MSVQTTVDATGLTVLADRLEAVPAALRPAMRGPLTAAGRVVRDAAARNAAWSSRIPAALRVRVSLGGRNGIGVTVSASHTAAPPARPYEGMVSNPFRHPVFGNREVWVPQTTRPFLRPAADASRAGIERAAEQAVSEAFARAGVSK